MKNLIKYSRKFSKKNAILLAVAAFALSASSAFSQSQCLQITTWRGGTGSWFTASNWNNGVPTSSINAQINNGGTAQINGGIPVAYACSLTLGANAGDAGNVSLDAVGGGGTLNVTNAVSVGVNGTGGLTLSNGAKVNAASLSVAKSGTVEFDVIPATSGMISVTGTATLNSESKLKVTMAGLFTPGTRYTLIQAGSLSGSFGTVSISYPHGQGFIPQITYDSTGHVYLYLQPIP
jgi:hypothetical protein